MKKLFLGLLVVSCVGAAAKAETSNAWTKLEGASLQCHGPVLIKDKGEFWITLSSPLHYLASVYRDKNEYPQLKALAMQCNAAKDQVIAENKQFVFVNLETAEVLPDD